MKCPNCTNDFIKNDDVECGFCGYTREAIWLRLVHEASGLTVTVQGPLTDFNRELMLRCLPTAKSPSDNLLAAYFPSGNAPLFTVYKTEKKWFFLPAAHRNSICVEGSPLPPDVPVEMRDKMVFSIYSANEGMTIADFKVVMGWD